MPSAILMERSMPLQAAFQVDRAFGNAGSLHTLGLLNGESRFGDLIIILGVEPDGLETLTIVLKGGKADTPLAFPQDVTAGMRVVQKGDQGGIIVLFADQKSPGA